MLNKIKEKLNQAKEWLKRQFKKILILTGGIALAATIQQATLNDISPDKVKQKYETATEIKAKYQLEGVEMFLPAKDSNSVKVKIGEKSEKTVGATTTLADVEFSPTLTLNRWDDEVSFKIKPDLSLLK